MNNHLLHSFARITGLLTLLIFSGVTQSATVSLSNDLVGMPGDTVTSFVTITDVSGLTIEAMDIWVDYDTSVLNFITGREGSGFDSALAPVINDVGPGQIRVSGLLSFLPVTAVENAVLFELDFQIRPDAPGGPTVQTFAQMDIDEAPQTTTVPSGSITVTAVPLPAAAWLLGSGLIGLFGVSRFKRA